MLERIRLHLPHYFSKHVSRKFISLAWSVGFMDLGLASVLIFEPVYLYTLRHSLSLVMVFYLAVYLLYFLFLPLVVRILSRIGVEHSIFYSQFFLIGYFLCLFGAAFSIIFLFIAPLMLVAQKLLYWPAYHVDFLLFSDTGQQGREVGSLLALSSIMYIIGPLIGGVVALWLGFPFLFLIAGILFFLSALPLLHIKEIHTLERETYTGILSHLKEKSQRSKLVRYLGFGEELLVLVVWPIFIYVVIHNYAVIGSLIAGATLITMLIVLVIGKKTDTSSRGAVSRTGTLGYVLAWLLRLIVVTSGLVFFVDALSRLTKNMLYVPLMTDLYEQADRTKVVGSMIFFEQALSIGKILGAAGALVLIAVFRDPWGPIFLIAALFSLLYLRGIRRSIA